MVLKAKYAISIYILLILLIVLILCVRSNFDIDNQITPSTTPPSTTGPPTTRPPTTRPPTTRPTTAPPQEHSDCEININTHLKASQLLVLKPNDAIETVDAFILPKDSLGGLGLLKFKTGEKLSFACPGEGNSIKIDGQITHQNYIEASCKKDTTFLIDAKDVAIEAIMCYTTPFADAKAVEETCNKEKKDKKIQIGFKIGSQFIKQLSVCFDEKLKTPLYTESLLTSVNGAKMEKVESTFVDSGNFYKLSSQELNTLYSKNVQRETINGILGLEPKSTSIIQVDNNYFLSRGHYAPKADFVYPAQQAATYLYINIAPQWQTFNGGNWKKMEESCRQFAADKALDLNIITGSFEISEMSDQKGTPQRLYLYTKSNSKSIPVPKLFFKVVYDDKSKAGVAFVGVNNPYVEKEEDIKNLVICEDVCDKIKWVTWDQKNNKLGYSYCCEVKELKKKILFIPDLDIQKLLV